MIRPRNDKRISREFPSVVAGDAGNERLWLQISQRNGLMVEGPRAYCHRLISTTSLHLVVAALPLHEISVNVALSIIGQLTCLQRPHWKASVSAQCSVAPKESNRFSSAILRFSACCFSEVIS